NIGDGIARAVEQMLAASFCFAEATVGQQFCLTLLAIVHLPLHNHQQVLVVIKTHHIDRAQLHTFHHGEDFVVVLQDDRHVFIKTADMFNGGLGGDVGGLVVSDQ